jgi:hypothetical protein
MKMIIRQADSGSDVRPRSAKTWKWLALLSCLIFVVPPIFWRWSEPVLSPFFVVALITAAWLWTADCSAQTRRKLLVLSIVLELAISIFWAKSIFQPSESRTGSFALCLGDGRLMLAIVVAGPNGAVVPPFEFLYRRVKNFGNAGLPWRLFWFDFLLSFRMPYVPGIIYHPITRTSSLEVFYAELPLWVLAAVSLTPLGVTISSKFKRRAHLSGTCRNCKYDLSGNVSGICPECGEIVPVRDE